MRDMHVIDAAGDGSEAVSYITPVPHIALQAFCETPDVAAMIQAASTDRRMAKAHVKLQMGGAAAALEAYHTAPTPNVIVLENTHDRATITAHLDQLAEYCDAGTKVLVIGHVNDVILYRDLMRRGVSEYLIAPLPPIEFVRTVSELFSAPSAEPLGRVIAVIGAKGGVGASTVSHNLAWAIARGIGVGTVLADCDVPFGTAGLDFNQDPPQGIAEAVFSAERLDATLLERLLSKCSDNLHLLAAPATLDRVADFQETAFEPVIDTLRGTVPCIVLDMPHLWSAWSRRVVMTADEILVVAEPDLGNLRNAKNLVDVLKASRSNDSKPRLVLNRIGIPKRPEIGVADFVKAAGAEVAAQLPFDAQLFGTAANNGQMIAEVQAGGKVAETFLALGQIVLGRVDRAKPKSGLSFIQPLLTKLKAKKA